MALTKDQVALFIIAICFILFLLFGSDWVGGVD